MMEQNDNAIKGSWSSVYNYGEGIINAKLNQMSKLEILTSLFERYKSDKLQHNYATYYCKHIPDKLHSMLELGVMNGASALAWRDFYSSDTEIYLADLFENEDWVSEKWCRNRGFISLRGNQGDLGFLETFPKNISLIIDDCSHVPQLTIASFKHLFLHSLKSGKCYCIEDLHTNLPENKYYWTGAIQTFEDTLLWMLENFKETGKIINPYFSEGEAAVFENIIDTVDIYERKIAFITKK
jgi:hypothetical protein